MYLQSMCFIYSIRRPFSTYLRMNRRFEFAFQTIPYVTRRCPAEQVERMLGWLFPASSPPHPYYTYFVQSEAKRQEQKAENTSSWKLLGPCAAFILISNTKSKGGNVNF